jgi:hypothetical protein
LSLLSQSNFLSSEQANNATVSPTCDERAGLLRVWFDQEVAPLALALSLLSVFLSCEMLIGLIQVFDTEVNSATKAAAADMEIVTAAELTGAGGIALLLSPFVFFCLLLFFSSSHRLAGWATGMLKSDPVVGGVWSGEKEGYVRVEDLYPALREVFDSSGRVTVERDCVITQLLPQPDGKVKVRSLALLLSLLLLHPSISSSAQEQLQHPNRFRPGSSLGGCQHGSHC